MRCNKWVNLRVPHIPAWITHCRTATLYYVHKSCCISASHAIILYFMSLSGCLSCGLAGWYFPDGSLLLPSQMVKLGLGHYDRALHTSGQRHKGLASNRRLFCWANHDPVVSLRSQCTFELISQLLLWVSLFNPKHPFSNHLEYPFTSRECDINVIGVAKHRQWHIHSALASSVSEGVLVVPGNRIRDFSLHESRLRSCADSWWWPLLSKAPSRAVHQSELDLHSAIE